MKPQQTSRQETRIKAFRMGLTAMALLLAASMVILLAKTAEKSKGPITNLMVMSSKVAEKAEETLVLAGRENVRAQRLAWFAPLADSRLGLIRNKAILLGAYDSESNDSYHALTAFEDSLHTTFPLLHIYTAWGDKEEQKFPETKVKQIRLMGSVPFITWEPWLTDFSSEEHPRIKSAAKRDPHGMRDVAKGMYDFYLKAWAAKAAASGGPLYIRLGHEMNDPYRYPWGPHNNTAKEFIAAWRHVRAVFKNAGAYNVVWVWSPHPAYGWFDAYYPGDEQVDMVGVGILNYGTVANWSQWWTFADIFNKPYKELAKYNKPIIITEFASLAVGGNRLLWYKSALTELPQSYPLVKGLMFFHVSADNTTTQQTLNWYIKDDPTLMAGVRSSLKGWPARQK